MLTKENKLGKAPLVSKSTIHEKATQDVTGSTYLYAGTFSFKFHEKCSQLVFVYEHLTQNSFNLLYTFVLVPGVDQFGHTISSLHAF